MMRYVMIALVALATAVPVPAAKKVNRNVLEAKQKELATLKSYLEAARDSLETEIAARWEAKQNFVKQRETDKEEQTRLREVQERAYNEIARVKETLLAREKQLEEERTALKERQEEWELAKTTVEELYAKEAEEMAGYFPVDMEERRAALEAGRRAYRKNYEVVPALERYFEYREAYLKKGTGISLDKQTIVPEGGDPELVTLARFGHVFAYGMNAGGGIFYIRQTGRLGIERYATVAVDVPEFKEPLQQAFPGWVEKDEVTGTIVSDVMQNNQTRVLLSGKKQGPMEAAYAKFKAGGAIMVPMLLVVLWAVALVILKLIQFSRKHTTNRDIYNDVKEHLDKGELDKALAHVQRIKSVVARVAETCLAHTDWKRKKVEKAIREILVDELPQLNKHLNTLGVIAGAAPMLGLLGTVTGMINLFEVITHYGTGDPKIMAGGISEALITTQAGLAIAIPILLIHNALRNRRDHIQSEMEKHAIRILNKLWPEE